MISVVFVTNGRGNYFRECLASYQANIASEDTIERIVVSDAPSLAYHVWLQDLVPDGWAKLVTTGGQKGLAAAVRAGWDTASGDYVFHVEEDFTFNETIDLDRLAALLKSRPELAQICLLRQPSPFSDDEMRAGGIVEKNPDAYEERHSAHGDYLVHREGFSLNPCLIPRVVYEQGCPDDPISPEAELGRRLVDQGFFFAYAGRKGDPPKVEHIGVTRAPGWKT